ncbi:MAG TPA: type II toxin-antitoxin system death-on-curing family toxin [Armatimonadota bacterium]|jgi:death-on-curing protein
MNVTFLTRHDVLIIHADMILRYGGVPGVRDEGLLDSALAMPSAGFGEQFLHPDAPAMAAAYLFHLVNNHPFIDGNKRVGAMAAYVFLDINGFDLAVPEEAFEAEVWGIARSENTKEQLTEFFRCHVVAR